MLCFNAHLNFKRNRAICLCSKDILFEKTQTGAATRLDIH